MSVVATYEGFKIAIAQILGSGQVTYQVEGIEDSLYGRATQTTIQESKDIIKKYLGTYIEPVRKVTEMSQEMLDQLNAGTLAIQRNVILEDILQREAERLTALKGTLEGQYQNLLGVQTSVGDVRDKVPLITDAFVTGLDQIRNTVTEGLDPIRDLTDRINEQTERAKDITSKFEGMSDTLDTIRENIKATVDAYEKALASKGAMGWLNKIPYIIGIGFAGIIVIKVLDVVD